MKVVDAAYQVLREANEPLHCREIARRTLEQELWTTTGKTPHATVYSRILREMQKHGAESRFCRPAPGIFGLTNPVNSSANIVVKSHGSSTMKVRSTSFTNAAEQILESYGGKQPMHYRAITEVALEQGLIMTSGKTPESTMYAQMHQDIERSQRRGERPRFVKHGQGFFGLSRWLGMGLAFQIERHNREVREKLLERVRYINPVEFEALVGRVLTVIGFDDVIVTNTSGDGGIDVRGTLIVGGVIRTRMAVQVKRWKNNVQAPVVQQVRGSLGAHEQGLIITTGDFSSGARDEAQRRDATPVGLMNGEQFVNLMIEHDIGIHRASHDIFELGEEDGEE